MRFELQHWFKGNIWPYPVALISLILVFYMIFPLLDGMILGMVFAYVGRPIRDLFGKRQMLGSFMATCCIVIPIFLIITLGTLEVVNQVMWLAGHKEEILNLSSRLIANLNIPPIFFDELAGSLKSIIDIAVSLAATMPVFGMGRSFSMGLLNFILSFLVCYFLLVDGSGLKRFIVEMLPTENQEINKKYFSRIDQIFSGIFLGSIYTSIAGGAVSVIIFYLFQVPRPFAMASIVFLAGLVPFLTWLVFIPTALYRYFVMGPIDALAFFLVGSILVHIAELVIRPYYVSSKSSLHPLLVILTFIGGGMVAGIGGFFLAPALLGLAYAIFQVKLEERMDAIEDRGNRPPQEMGKLLEPQSHPPS